MKINSFLQRVTESTLRRIEFRKKALPLSELLEQLALKKERKLNSISKINGIAKNRTFISQLCNKDSINIIAEVKYKSPSQGVISNINDPVGLANGYYQAGAVAISILTEPEYFGGDIENIKRIRKQLPSAILMQKDFIIDEYQIYEAFYYGADIILLIVAVLGSERTRRFLEVARSLGLSALVEVHTEEEMNMALNIINIGTSIIGINNRDLHTLSVSLNVSRRLASMIPEEVLVISESGIESLEEINELRALGYHGFLMGTSLVKNSSPTHFLDQLISNNNLKAVL